MTLRAWAQLALVSFVFALGCPVKASISFSEAATLTPTFDKATQMVSVQIRIADGFHAYAAGEKIGKPVDILIKPLNGWKANGTAILPQGKEITLKSLQKSVILDGLFTVKAKVYDGKGPVAGEVHLQVCSDDACDRPRVYPFTVGL